MPRCGSRSSSASSSASSSRRSRQSLLSESAVGNSSSSSKGGSGRSSSTRRSFGESSSSGAHSTASEVSSRHRIKASSSRCSCSSSSSSPSSSKSSDSSDSSSRAAPSGSSSISSSRSGSRRVARPRDFLWECCCSPTSRLTAECLARRKPARRLTLETGYDFTSRRCVRRLRRKVEKYRPQHVWAAIPCTSYSPMQNLQKKTPRRLQKLAKDRKITRKMVRLTTSLLRAVAKRGGHVYFEWPLRSQGWPLLGGFTTWLERRGAVFEARVDGCRYNLQNLAGDALLQKSWRVLTSNECLALNLTARCIASHRSQSRHQIIQGQLQTAASAFYPQAMVSKILDIWLS